MILVTRNKSKTYIAHFGIKGQKWGQRRYQNKDGSLTPEGKKRYSEDYQSMREIRSKPVSSMTNKELESAIRRMNLERQYRDLSRSERDRGKQTVKDILDYANTAVAFYNLYNSPTGKAIKSALTKR